MKTRVIALSWVLTALVAGATESVCIPCAPCATDGEAAATSNQTAGSDAKTAAPAKPTAPAPKSQRKDRQPPPRPNYLLM